ncbi:hypothetical protein ILUMI_18791 [Ignelater luminosus]|uniref:F-box domain-containing protein n=1 Tax=Ignelater luminosus TaxID=2038154 RepID=A0A8K0G3T6_IGNLU|nr:hypothetical protein ILUMI_18791 [Ignelater luminosus]
MVLLNKECLVKIFSYLDKQDIVSCSLVNSLWKDTALKVITARTTERLKIRLYDDFLALSEYDTEKTVHLDLTQMILPDSISGVDIGPNGLIASNPFWNDFATSIEGLQQLRIIELRYCPAYVIEDLCVTHPFLHKIKSIDMSGPALNLDYLRECISLKELCLQFHRVTCVSFYLDHDIDDVLNNLLEFTLTGMCDLNNYDILQIINFNRLQSLSLGGCAYFSQEFTITLKKLVQLKKLRLERCRGLTVLAIFEAVATMHNLKHLEMVDINIPGGIDSAIARCTNLTKLLIAPYFEQLEDINNRRIICGIVKLRRNLKQFKWVFARESSSESHDDIIISKQMPYLDEYGNLQVPLTTEKESVVFDSVSLETFIELFIPNCIVSVKRTSYVNMFSLQL